MGNWSLSFRNDANGSNALGRNRIHDEYSPGLDHATNALTLLVKIIPFSKIHRQKVGM